MREELNATDDDLLDIFKDSKKTHAKTIEELKFSTEVKRIKLKINHQK